MNKTTGPRVVLHRKTFEKQTEIKSKDTKSNMATAANFNKKFENDVFLSLMKQTKLKQNQTMMNLKKEKKVSKSKLPKTLLEIDSDVYLSTLLLKNPEFMTEEEKNFIYSFNKQEKLIFLEYLKMKSLEKNWMGNGYGGGNYLSNFHSIYRNKEKENKTQNFKQYLKSFGNFQEKEMEKQNLNFKNKVRIY